MFGVDILIYLFAMVLTELIETDLDDEDIRLPEGATGRPVPPELEFMFLNKSYRDQELEVCMGEMMNCHKLKHEVSQKVCAHHSTARKTFKDMCELHYENCKAPLIDPPPEEIYGPEYLHPQTVGPDVELWQFSHDGECSAEVA